MQGYYDDNAEGAFSLSSSRDETLAQRALRGARLKLTRHAYTMKDPNGGKPLLDCGLGLSLDMDKQRLQV